MVTRAQQKERTRTAILTAARDLFIEAGFKETNIRLVARAAGVGIGTVHAHFVDKNELLLACFNDQIASTAALALESSASETTLEDKLCRIAEVLFAGYCRHPDLTRQMLSASLFDGRDDPLTLDFLSAVAAMFREARDDGQIGYLPGEGMQAAHNYFALYILTLIGGFKGLWGPPEAPEAPALWANMLRVHLGLLIRGVT